MDPQRLLTLGPARGREPLLKPAWQRDLERIFPPQDRLLAPADRLAYGYDNSQRLHSPQAVVFPRNHQQTAELVALCRHHRLALTCRGRGTGTAGAAVPVAGGIVASFERMDAVLELDPADRLAVVQPGVTNAALQQAAGAHGFFWPPDPTSAAVCTIGGNLACNAAGPRAVRYGTCRENTLGLTAVDGTGRTLHTGVRTTKGVVGYDLTRLLIGSEGTLAVITEATLRLAPLPGARRTLQAVYADVAAAAAAVSAIMAQPVIPSALEFMDGRAIEMVRNHADPGLPPGAGALLMIELEGHPRAIEAETAELLAAARVPGCLSAEAAANNEQVERLWRARKALSPALRNVAPKKINEDVVVPVSRIPELVSGLERLADRHGLTIVNFGHAGNGNLHVNLLVDPDDPGQKAAAEACLDEIFDLVLRLGGTLSGEHGIGLVKLPFVAREIDDPTLAAMCELKKVFDPQGILNPGKGVPCPPTQESSP